MIAHVSIEFAAQAAAFPIRHGIPRGVEKRTAAEIEIADQRSAEVADVRDGIAGSGKRHEKLDRDHDRDVHAH